jgi:hypothetical protein
MQVGIDSFAAAFDENSRAVTVLSAEDPVRAFQNFATIDLLSRGRAEMIVGRGSSIVDWEADGDATGGCIRCIAGG